MLPHPLHSKFFSSLKQVEKRLKLDNPPGENTNTPLETLSSPLYLNFEQPSATSCSTSQDSEPPKQFLTSSFDFSQSEDNPPALRDPKEPHTFDGFKFNGADEIDLLFQLLGLSDCDTQREGELRRDVLNLKNGGDDGGFYAKVVGVKGPKCGKEVERMDGWIKHFMSDCGERKQEPLRLAHLLLGKAAFLSQDSDSFEELEFPLTIEEFLQSDPPEQESSL